MAFFLCAKNGGWIGVCLWTPRPMTGQTKRQKCMKKHHLFVVLKSLAILAAFPSGALATPPTPLYPRSDGTTCVYSGSTGQTLQSSPGSSLSVASFTTTNVALDFYSTPLTNSLALGSADSSDGTVNVTNTGAALPGNAANGSGVGCGAGPQNRVLS